MTDWKSLLDQPLRSAPADWFAQIAKRLLQQTQLIAADKSFRVIEIEFYLHHSTHPDFFAHCQPIQRTWGKWYFHRTGTGFRGGSFKGLDLTFGDQSSFGGILIRTLETSTGEIISGPSLCVDRLLASTEAPTVAELDKQVESYSAFDDGSPLRLAPKTITLPDRLRRVYTTSRVGLSLKRARHHSQMRFLVRPYRFLTNPRQVPKGKVQLALALHAAGTGQRQIHNLTGSPYSAIRRYVQEFEQGCSEKNATRFLGLDLTTAQLCRLHGALHDDASDEREGDSTA